MQLNLLNYYNHKYIKNTHQIFDVYFKPKYIDIIQNILTLQFK